MILKINFKIIFINYDFKINLKPYLPTTILRLIFKTVVDECGFKVNEYSLINILKRKK